MHLLDSLISIQTEIGELETLSEESIRDEREDKHQVKEIQETEGESEEYEISEEEMDRRIDTIRSRRLAKRPQKSDKKGFVVNLNSEPINYAKATSRKDAEKWKEAVEIELSL